MGEKSNITMKIVKKLNLVTSDTFLDADGLKNGK
jgi:hypothetical protein